MFYLELWRLLKKGFHNMTAITVIKMFHKGFHARARMLLLPLLPLQKEHALHHSRVYFKKDLKNVMIVAVDKGKLIKRGRVSLLLYTFQF